MATKSFYKKTTDKRKNTTHKDKKYICMHKYIHKYNRIYCDELIN